MKDEAIRLFARDAMFGLKAQLETGDGSEFHALRELPPGMDRRTIDWKQSARHGKLLAKEFRTERNHPVIFAIDTGRLMCEPLLGAPRIDRAINAALLMAFVVAEARRPGRASSASTCSPRLFTGATSGAHAFPLLQRLAARLDYSTEETNYTLGLTQLGAALERRSLVVVFTDFADTTSAELMLENVGAADEAPPGAVRDLPRRGAGGDRPPRAGRPRSGLARRHRRGAAERARPGDRPAAAAWAPTSSTPPPRQVGPALLSAYIDLKRRDLL